MEKSSRWIVSSRSQVAEFFGVTPTLVNRDWAHQGMPGSRGNYPLDEIAQWRDGRLRETLRPGPSQEDKDLQERLEIAQVEKAEFDAKLQELKLRSARGELVNRDAAKAEVEEMFHRVRARLEQIPQEVAGTVPPELRADVIADWRHKVSLVLKEMEGWGDGELGE